MLRTVLRIMVLFIACSHVVKTKEYLAVRDWGPAQNVDLAMIQAAAQTLDGYLWFGSPAGLYRFNGHDFRSFDPRPGDHEELPHITALLADREGPLWIGTQSEGLYRFTNGQTITYGAAEGLTNDRIKCLYQDGTGTVWVGTDGGGAFRWTGTRFEPLKLSGAPNLLHPTAFGEDSRGRFWVGTFRDGAFRLSGEQIDFHLKTVPTVRGIRSGPDGRLWFLTMRGPAWLDGDRVQRIEVPTSEGTITNRVYVTSVTQDRSATFWIGTLRGLLRLGTEGPSFVDGSDTLGNGLVTAVFADREGSIWAGTEVGALHQIRRQKIKIVPPFENGLQSVLTLDSDPEGRLWVGGSEGLVAWRAERRVWSPSRESAAAQEICATGRDAEGRRWFAQRFGNWGYLDGDQAVIIPSQRLTTAQRSPTFFLQTRNHGFLAGTPDHFVRIQQDHSLVAMTNLGLSHFGINCAHESPDGSLWVGTSYGLNRIRNGTVSSYIRLPQRPMEVVTSITGDADGTLWISSFRGLWRWRNDTFFAFGPEHGLPARTASLVDDGHGSLWINAGSLIRRISKDQLNAVADGRQNLATSTSWDREDGLASPIRAGASYGAVLPDGQVCFGTDAGIAFLHRHDPLPNDIPPTPIIEYLIANGEVQDWSTRGGSAPRRIVLPPGYQRVEIHFTALSFRSPSRVTYAHRLLGLAPDWESSQTHRFASFRALPPGTYNFEVQATNESGLASSHPATLEIVALAPWWNTTAARALGALGFLTVAALAYGVRVRHLKQLSTARRDYSRRLLDHQESERSRLAREIHDGLGQDLLIIKNQAAMLDLDLPRDPEVVRSRLRQIASTSQSAIDQAREIAHNLRPAELDRVGLAASVEAMVERASSSSAIAFECRIAPIEGCLSPPAEVLVYRISQELVNNILKHSRASRASLELDNHPEEALIELRVEDNGQGFDAIPGAARGGLGLASVRERVAMLRGSAEVTSALGKGTTWHIRLPTSPARS